MSSSTLTQTAVALRRAAVRATLAPSVHNTQPWRFVLAADHLDIHADWDRQLRVLDPRGRQLLISCGCALFNVRVALAVGRFRVRVERFPDPDNPGLLARLTPLGSVGDAAPLAALDAAIDVRRTNRRRFADEPVPDQVVRALISAANAEGAELLSITEPEHRRALARLSQDADRIEVADPSYRAELRAWTSDDPRRPDGVSASAVPYAGPYVGRSVDAMPIRVFDTTGMGWLPADSHSGDEQCLLLLGTRRDDSWAWLAAGEALERVLLEITRRGYAASPLTQVIEVAQTNERLRHELRLSMYPDVLLRVGLAPETVPTRRRRLVDVLTEKP